MSEFNIEDLDAVIAQGREGSLAQMLALQLKSQIRKGEQLAAENVTARNAVQVFCDVVGANTDAICEEVGPEGVRAILAGMSATGNMPATDRIVAGIKADGVEEFIGRLQQHVDEGDFVGDEVAVIVGAIDCGKEFREQLREGADK